MKIIECEGSPRVYRDADGTLYLILLSGQRARLRDLVAKPAEPPPSEAP